MRIWADAVRAAANNNIKNPNLFIMCLLQYNLNYHIDRSEVPARKYSSATVMTFKLCAYEWRRHATPG
jgi:hypothetical protein